MLHDELSQAEAISTQAATPSLSATVAVTAGIDSAKHKAPRLNAEAIVAAIESQVNSKDRFDILIDGPEAANKFAAAFQLLIDRLGPDVGSPSSGLHIILALSESDKAALDPIYDQIEVTRYRFKQDRIAIHAIERALENTLRQRVAIDHLVFLDEEALDRYIGFYGIPHTILNLIHDLRAVQDMDLINDIRNLPLLLLKLSA